MRKVIQFRPKEPTLDQIEDMEAVIWESMEKDEAAASAVAGYVYELQLSAFTALVQAVAEYNVFKAYSIAHDIVNEATIKAARAALRQRGKQ